MNPTDVLNKYYNRVVGTVQSDLASSAQYQSALSAQRTISAQRAQQGLSMNTYLNRMNNQIFAGQRDVLQRQATGLTGGGAFNLLNQQAQQAGAALQQTTQNFSNWNQQATAQYTEAENIKSELEKSFTQQEALKLYQEDVAKEERRRKIINWTVNGLLIAGTIAATIATFGAAAPAAGAADAAVLGGAAATEAGLSAATAAGLGAAEATVAATAAATEAGVAGLTAGITDLTLAAANTARIAAPLATGLESVGVSSIRAFYGLAPTLEATVATGRGGLAAFETLGATSLSGEVGGLAAEGAFLASEGATSLTSATSASFASATTRAATMAERVATEGGKGILGKLRNVGSRMFGRQGYARAYTKGAEQATRIAEAGGRFATPAWATARVIGRGLLRSIPRTIGNATLVGTAGMLTGNFIAHQQANFGELGKQNWTNIFNKLGIPQNVWPAGLK